MRGASAIEQFLERHRAAPVRVFVIWEPMRFVDWQRPTTKVLRRLSDSRVAQFWDHDHLVAKLMAKDATDSGIDWSCCEHDRILWDIAAVYPIGSKWSNHLPPPIVFNGPVVNALPKIRAVISSD